MHIEAHSDEDLMEHLSERLLIAGHGLEKSLELMRRRLIIDALRMCRGSQTRAAKYLHVHRNTVVRSIREMKIDKKLYKPQKPSLSERIWGKEEPGAVANQR